MSLLHLIWVSLLVLWNHIRLIHVRLINIRLIIWYIILLNIIKFRIYLRCSSIITINIWFRNYWHIFRVVINSIYILIICIYLNIIIVDRRWGHI